MVDGDTVDVELQGQRVQIRVYGIDTPETQLCGSRTDKRSCAKCEREQQLGRQAKAAAAALLPIGSEVQIGIVARPADKYGRLLATITIGVSDYGAILKRRGLAAPYSGRGPKPDWCADVKAW